MRYFQQQYTFVQQLIDISRVVLALAAAQRRNVRDVFCGTGECCSAALLRDVREFFFGTAGAELPSACFTNRLIEVSFAFGWLVPIVGELPLLGWPPRGHSLSGDPLWGID